MLRSGYSFKTAYGHLRDVISRIQEIGWEVAPLSDRVSTFSFGRFTKACKAAGLRPVYGVEIGVVPELGVTKPPVDYWKFLAKEKLSDLNAAIYQATWNVGKEATLSYSEALSSQGLIKIAGERLLLEKIPPEQYENPDFYVALSPASPGGLVRRGMRAGLRFVAMSENYYPRPADEEEYRIALGFRAATQTYPRYILSDDELNQYLVKVGHDPDLIKAAFINRDAILDQCRATLKQAQLLVPEKPKSLLAMCEEGAALKGLDLSDEVYRARLIRELDLIHEKNFDDYFYILADIVNWSKSKMVVGPGRGSSGGSLVCYCLNITEIDPIRHGLLFERFIDANRFELPDIDVDFSDVNRDMVFKYAETKYGAERVARLGTVGVFKGRSALKAAGAGLQIPVWKTDKLMDHLIERTSGDSRANNTLEDTLTQTAAGQALLREHPEIIIAAKFESHPVNPSQHAAGVVLTQDPLIEYVALDARTKSVMCDKKDCGDLNLLKIDALGLKQLSIFERTLELIGEKPVNGFLERVPLDDGDAFDILNTGRFAGIFQFTGIALRSVATQVKFTCFEDVAAMTALVRPGPLATGGTSRWVRRKRGEETPIPLHPLLTDLTRETYGVILYQEQVMRVVREIGLLSWEDTGAIRHAMSGILGDEFFGQYWEKFKQGAATNGLDEATAKTIWDQICTFGSWAFNKSHSIAYGLVSYYCCWLKAHYPLEFAAATLDAEPEATNQLNLLRELDREGIKYTPVDPDASVERWSIADTPTGKVLVGPLTSIKGIGPKKVKDILNARASGQELKPALKRMLEEAKTEIDDLYPISAKIRRLHPDLGEINIFSRPMPVEKVQPGVQGEVMIFALARRVKWRDENDAQKLAQREGRRLNGPTEVLNCYFTDDTDEIFVKFDRFNFERLGKKVMDKARAGKSLFAIKGTVPPDFRMIKATAARYLGEIDA